MRLSDVTENIIEQEMLASRVRFDSTLEDIRDWAEMAMFSSYHTTAYRRAGRFVADALAPVFGDVDCRMCGGEGYTTEVVPYFDMREEQWYPEYEPVRCPRCGGDGVEPWPGRE